MCRQTNKICEKCGTTKKQLVKRKGNTIRCAKIYCPTCKAEKDRKRYQAAQLKDSPEEKRRKAERNAGYAKLRRKNEKERVMLHYSEKTFGCSCCGIKDIEFLTIDHIAGGGNIHRKEIKKTAGHHFYRWLIRNNMPKGFRTLCYNCNNARAYYGTCPHEKNV